MSDSTKEDIENLVVISGKKTNIMPSILTKPAQLDAVNKSQQKLLVQVLTKPIEVDGKLKRVYTKEEAKSLANIFFQVNKQIQVQVSVNPTLVREKAIVPQSKVYNISAEVLAEFKRFAPKYYDQISIDWSLKHVITSWLSDVMIQMRVNEIKEELKLRHIIEGIKNLKFRYYDSQILTLLTEIHDTYNTLEMADEYDKNNEVAREIAKYGIFPNSGGKVNSPLFMWQPLMPLMNDMYVKVDNVLDYRKVETLDEDENEIAPRRIIVCSDANMKRFLNAALQMSIRTGTVKCQVEKDKKSSKQVGLSSPKVKYIFDTSIPFSASGSNTMGSKNILASSKGIRR